jgi:hypothetical protein
MIFFLEFDKINSFKRANWVYRYSELIRTYATVTSEDETEGAERKKAKQ